MSRNNFEAELSRFENEISNVNVNNGPPRMPMMPSIPPPPNMFPPMMPGIPPLPPPPPNVMAQLLNNNPTPNPPPSRLPSRPAFLPPQLRQRIPQQSMPFRPRSSSSSMGPHHSGPNGTGPMMNNNSAMPLLGGQQQLPSAPAPPPVTQSQPVLSAKPMLYKNQTTQEKSVPPSESSVTPAVSRPPVAATTVPPVTTTMAAAAAATTTTPTGEVKSVVPKSDKPTTSTKSEEAPHPLSKAYAQTLESNDHDMETSSSSKKKNKGKAPKKPRHVRMAGGTSWEDETLGEWDSDDFRLFCGDLGNEVNDDVLTRAFNKYPSFLKARVVRDKRSGKTRGYGFVSFKDSQDYIRAMREMNGKYVGNRPIKLRKSTWQERNIDTVKRKMKDKMRMGLR